MRQAILLPFLLLTACGGGRDQAQNAAPRRGGPAVQTASLTGLYEASASGGERAQMCMISDGSGAASFGIVTEAPGRGSCGGAGTATRAQGTLRLAMTGDEQCVIEAKIDGTKVTFPSTLAEGCSYYCGPGATLAGQSFEKTGGTDADAMRAKDLAGEALCG